MKKFITVLLCILLTLTGCSAISSDAETEPSSVIENSKDEEIEYTSKIKKEDCALCGKQEGSQLPIYKGQNNLGIICINTFDLSPIQINRYDDYGNYIQEEAGYTSVTHNSFGEDNMITSVSANPDRAYAHVHVGFTKDDAVNKEKVETLLCQDCLDAIMEESWGKPYGVGVINFDTFEVRLFEENISGFSFGDYYLDIDLRENDGDSEWTEMDMFVVYCPVRYK